MRQGCFTSCATATTRTLRDEKFWSSFFKSSRAPRAEPLVASAEAKLILGVSIREANYWFIFFAPAVSKKRTERIRMRYIEKTLSVLFLSK